MTIPEAIVLGLVQALTEFLPVSSSGHLRLARELLGAQAEFALGFDLLLHIGTLVAVVAVYRGTIARVAVDAVRGLVAMTRGPVAALEKHEGLRFAILVVIASVPTGIIGLTLDDLVEGTFVTAPVVGALLLVNGVMLWVARRDDGEEPGERRWAVAGIGPREALLIGLAQGIAVLPGISRSGATIVMALALGARRMKAAEFSFLLSIPAIAGAAVLKLDSGLFDVAPGEAMAWGIGAVTSALAGIGALVFLLGTLRRARFHRFSFYCWALGTFAIVAGLAGWTGG